jgi:MOSC domain-containing protein YiiM
VILQLNISRGGLPKRPVPEAYLAPTGLKGDSWAHPQYHGGPLQAILLITSETLEELRTQGYGVYAGALGENFTTAGLDRGHIRIGDRYCAGQAIIEITKLRVPCATLNVFNAPGLPRIQDAVYDQRVKAGDAASSRWGLGGFYARVLEAGLVQTGDPIAKVV